MANKQKVLVTGSTGFFGKNLIARLNTSDYIVHTLQANLTKEREVFGEVREFNPDIAYHLGAHVNLARTYKEAKLCIDVNTRGTLILLESLKTVPLKKFIYTSTEEVYGDGELPYRESQQLHPPSFYAVSKVAAEQLISIYSQISGFQGYIFRIGTAYGYYQPMFRLIPQIITKALKNEDILLNSGMKKRDYVYIEDVVDALDVAARKKIPDKILLCTLGGGLEYTLRSLVECVMRITKSRSNIVYGAYPDRVLETDEWLLDNAQAYRYFGWKPNTSLENGLTKTITFYKRMLGK